MTTRLEGNELKQLLRDSIKPGQTHAIKGDILAQMAGYKDTRIIRNTILEIIEQEKIPIASGVGKFKGYYVAETQKEYDDFIELMESYWRETYHRELAFKTAFQSRQGQMKLV